MIRSLRHRRSGPPSGDDDRGNLEARLVRLAPQAKQKIDGLPSFMTVSENVHLNSGRTTTSLHFRDVRLSDQGTMKHGAASVPSPAHPPRGPGLLRDLKSGTARMATQHPVQHGIEFVWIRQKIHADGHDTKDDDASRM